MSKTHAASPSGNAAVYTKVFAALTESLEKGVVPWTQKDWVAATHCNAFTRHAYQGGNTLAVMVAAWLRGFASNGWATWAQIAKHGGRVKDGQAKEYTWVYLMRSGVKRPKAGAPKDAKPEKFFIARAFHIYNLDQTEGLDAVKERLAAGGGYDGDPLDDAEAMVTRLGVPIAHGGDTAAYLPVEDRILMPPRRAFRAKDRYYATLFHEMTHATGHPTRLDRAAERLARFGSPAYAFEELVAELGALFLASDFGFTHVSQAASYIASWQRAIKEDGNVLPRAAAEASKACTFLGAPSTIRPATEDDAAEAA